MGCRAHCPASLGVAGQAQSRGTATLLALATQSGPADWLAVTPEGYANGSELWTKSARWRANTIETAAGPIWTSVRHPPLIVRAIRGDIVPAPTFEK